MGREEITGIEKLDDAATKLEIAIDAYHQASQYGYPARQAAAMNRAQVAYDEIKAQYPIAAALRLAESYSRAANDGKATAGDRAIKRILAGEDHQIAIAEMEDEWTAEAHRRVNIT